ncbi:MAG: polyprenyl synthetase family protein [Candidatus Cloacimonetes bacterium]|jgi:geranylgeranyl diphosphate synthase type II|nr:polyprenyl synthetase family protein [Candidatus Cloacimonadota bacterium]MDD2210811.1 polyprenyl synthetase family protein [Candidatus Cloacimonadota bacterium]MDD4231511.1 polyprenyl synthetase family protein [Candidatus Cloacimonadota bacterium]MDD4687252.1 polyprenyl synthetase family protein [Candidatus Cloacimonadota bacterium]MDY0298197.1 polyprenyl synthetase family protein [Candidatus Cloacimonadaceae bacterium]
MDPNVLLKKDMKEKQELVNIILDRYLPRKDEYPKEIHKALRYSTFAGGKRLRPYLTLLAYQMYKEDLEPIIPVAAAIEMIHTYTLIHDDLPDIDDDDYRRGKKSCHTVFGEGVALLAGDSLLINAFELITYASLSDALKVQFVRELATESGIKGVIAGQNLDIESEGKKVDKKTLNYIHNNKTAKLINIGLRFGALAAKAPAKELAIIEDYGSKIGLVFQIVDDLLDIEGSEAKLGKTTGKDEAAGKVTFPSVYGVETSREMARDLTEKAKENIAVLGERTLLLRILADFLLNRKS